MESRGKIMISKSKISKLLKEEDAKLLSNFVENDSGKWGIKVAKQLIESKNFGILSRNLSRFEWLDAGIAEMLIKYGFLENLAKNLSSFENLNQKIAKALMGKRMGSVSNNLRLFDKLDNTVAQILIENNYYDAVARDIDKFEKLNNETLLSLLVKCTKYKWRIFLNRSIFPKWWKKDNVFLASLKSKWKDVEYKKLKEFYDKVSFEEKKELFKLDNKPSKLFDVTKAKEAVKYWKWEYVLQHLDDFQTDNKELIALLIKWWYIDEIKNALPNLWGRNLDWDEIVYQISLMNDYNLLVKYADNFKAEWVSNVKIWQAILKNCDLSCRDSVKMLSDYSDNWDWDWVNYNFDLYELVNRMRRTEFLELLEYFKSDFSPLSVDKKLPLKLKNLIKQNLWADVIEEYQDLFE